MLNTNIPRKKYICGNDKPFLKAKRSRNTLLGNPTDESKHPNTD